MSTQVSYILLLTLLLFPHSLFDVTAIKTGTCIVYVRIPSAIWVGADSLVVQLKTGVQDRRSCKIHRSGNTYFAFTGLSELGGVFDAVKVAESSISSNATASIARDNFVKSMTPLFEKAMPVLRRYYPRYYSESWERSDLPKFVFFEVIFWGFENNSTTVEYAAFRVQALPNGKKRVVSDKEDCPGKDCTDQVTLKPLGKNKAFQPPFDWGTAYTGNPVATIQRMIRLEMDSEPKWVGGDINVVKLDASGTHWLTSYSECPEG